MTGYDDRPLGRTDTIRYDDGPILWADTIRYCYDRPIRGDDGPIRYDDGLTRYGVFKFNMIRYKYDIEKLSHYS